MKAGCDALGNTGPHDLLVELFGHCPSSVSKSNWSIYSCPLFQLFPLQLHANCSRSPTSPLYQDSKQNSQDLSVVTYSEIVHQFPHPKRTFIYCTLLTNFNNYHYCLWHREKHCLCWIDLYRFVYLKEVYKKCECDECISGDGHHTPIDWNGINFSDFWDQ